MLFPLDSFDVAEDPSKCKPVKILKEEKNKLKYEEKKKRALARHRAHKMKKHESIESMNDEARLMYIQTQKEIKNRERENAKRSLEAPVRVCIDLDYMDENSDKEMRSLVVQVRLSYVEIKRALSPLSLHLCSLTGKIHRHLADQGVDNWFVHRHSETVLDTFPSQNIVILSPDAEEALMELDPLKVYVIGGIVDRTIRKHISLSKANDHEVQAVRLPIREYFPDCPNTVLNIDQVLRCLCVYNHTTDWVTALREAVPVRRAIPGREERQKRADMATADNLVLDTYVTNRDDTVDEEGNEVNTDKEDDYNGCVTSG